MVNETGYVTLVVERDRTLETHQAFTDAAAGRAHFERRLAANIADTGLHNHIDSDGNPPSLGTATDVRSVTGAWHLRIVAVPTVTSHVREGADHTSA